MITWQGLTYKATILEDFKIEVKDSKFGYTTKLDQCRHCGEWKSEDEELYGDGYCDGCAAMCIHCSTYFNAADMIPPKKDEEEYVCKECHLKECHLNEAKRLWIKLRDIPTNKDEAIDVDWHIFTKGTDIEYIWHWFEEEFDLSVAKDLMGL
jgi:hypothetical protein